MAETFQLEIVTPDRLIVSDTAEEMQLPGKNGYLGILPGHAPLITELGVGELSYRRGGEVKRIALAWGFAEVLPTKVTVLAETAETAGEIDVSRAEKAKERAASRLQKASPDTDFARAQEALDRAGVRLNVAEKK